MFTIVSQWLAAAIISWRASAHALSLTQMGFAVPKPTLTILVSTALAGIIAANQLLSIREFAKRPLDAKGILPRVAAHIFPQDNFERAVFIPVVVTVAFCEEIIYRGFVQSVFQRYFTVGPIVTGIAVSAIFFAVAHLYQGPKGMIATFIVGIVFSASRAWTGSLLPEIVSHALADAMAGLLMPKKLLHNAVLQGKI